MKIINACECGHAPRAHVFRDGEYHCCKEPNCSCEKYLRKSGALRWDALRMRGIAR